MPKTFKYIFAGAVLMICAAATYYVQTTRTASSPIRGAVITDHRVYDEGTPPALPRAGGTFTDPVFGTTLLRVTDETDGKACHNSYSYWETFSLDDTRFFIACDNEPKLYRFDPNSFKILGKGPLFDRPPGDSGYLSAEDAIWSTRSATVLYSYAGLRLYSYDVVTRRYALVKDFTADLRTGYLGQMSMSADENVFAFTKKDTDWKPYGYLVWRRDQDRVLRNANQTEFDEVQVDKSGRYATVKAHFTKTVDVQVVDLQTGSVENLTDPAPDFSPGHSDNGWQIVVGHDNWNNQYTFRRLATPHQFKALIGFGSDWSQANHVSMLADNESWCVISNFTAAKGPVGPFRNEIFQVATDGSQRVRRLAHHHSVYRDYWDTPRADISRDGKFIAFTSNWGSTARRDVFIIKVPPMTQ